MKKNTVRVYDTISKRIVEVEVSDEARTHYNRTQWNIDDNTGTAFRNGNETCEDNDTSVQSQTQAMRAALGEPQRDENSMRSVSCRLPVKLRHDGY